SGKPVQRRFDGRRLSAQGISISHLYDHCSRAGHSKSLCPAESLQLEIVVAGEKVQTAVCWGQGFEPRSIPLLQQVFDFIESDHIAPESQFSPDLPLANPDDLVRLIFIAHMHRNIPYKFQRFALQFRQLLQTVQVVAPEPVHSLFHSLDPFSFFWQVSNRFLVACRRRLFRISETRKLHVGDAAIASLAPQRAFIRDSLFAFACPSAVLTGELQNFPIRIPSIQLLLPDSRFWWTLSRSAP